MSEQDNPLIDIIRRVTENSLENDEALLKLGRELASIVSMLRNRITDLDTKVLRLQEQVIQTNERLDILIEVVNTSRRIITH